MKKHYSPKQILMGAILAVFGVGLLVTAMLVPNASKPAAAVTQPVSLIGKWYEVKSDATDNFYAEISPNAIQVDMSSRDGGGGHYWLGTFNTNSKVTGPVTIVSLGDQDAMAKSLMASGDATKEFEYKNGILSFQFSALGVTTTIHLQKKTVHTTKKVVPTISVPAVKIPSVKKPIAKAPKVTTPKQPAYKAPRVTTNKK